MSTISWLPAPSHYLWTLRQQGSLDDAIHEVFLVVIIKMLTHASPAWWGFAFADDRNRLLKAVKLSYWAKCSTTFASICDDAGCKLFAWITGNTQHLLYLLLPSRAPVHSVSLSTQSQLSSSWSHASSQRQKLYHENVVLWLSALITLFYLIISLCNSVLSLLFYLKLKWNEMNEWMNGLTRHSRLFVLVSSVMYFVHESVASLMLDLLHGTVFHTISIKSVTLVFSSAVSKPNCFVQHTLLVLVSAPGWSVNSAIEIIVLLLLLLLGIISISRYCDIDRQPRQATISYSKPVSRVNDIVWTCVIAI